MAKSDAEPSSLGYVVVGSANGTVQGVDEMDQLIIDKLRENGRITVRDLAAVTELTEATVRARMRALERVDLLRITATVNIELLGEHYFAPVGVVVSGRPVDDVAEDLAKIPEVVTLMTMIGPQDIEMQVATRSLEDLRRALTTTIPSVPGVAKLARSLTLDTVKFESRWMPFK